MIDSFDTNRFSLTRTILILLALVIILSILDYYLFFILGFLYPAVIVSIVALVFVFLLLKKLYQGLDLYK